MKSKKLTIDVKNYSGKVFFTSFRDVASNVAFRHLLNLTRNELVAELKARRIPVPKYKQDMADRLADRMIKAGATLTVTIG